MTVDEMTEEAAMALLACDEGKWDSLPQDEQISVKSEVEAALKTLGIPLETLAALKAGTMKAVPVEPTEEMRRSGNNVQVGNWYRHIECSEHGTEYVPHCDECNNAPVINTLIGDSSADVFKAMLAAAPANPESENDR